MHEMGQLSVLTLLLAFLRKGWKEWFLTYYTGVLNSKKILYKLNFEI